MRLQKGRLDSSVTFRTGSDGLLGNLDARRRYSRARHLNTGWTLAAVIAVRGILIPDARIRPLRQRE